MARAHAAADNGVSPLQRVRADGQRVHPFTAAADGSLFCAALIQDTPGLMLGTTIPAEEWKKK